MLEQDIDHAGEPPLRIAAMGLLVPIDEGLVDFFSGDPCDKRRAAHRARSLGKRQPPTGGLPSRCASGHWKPGNLP
jgi:hypothetical protein